VKPRAWYRISAQADAEIAELLIFDEIGRSFWNDEAVTAKQFLADLQALPETVKTLRVRVNSPGGDPFDAAAIANALRAQRTEKGRTVEVSIEGLAASAASIVTSAGNPIRMADNAILMIHNPFALVVGDAGDMRKMAEALDAIRNAIIATYQWVSPLEVDALAALMDAETWMDAPEALKNGLATEIVAGVQAAASLRPDVLGRLGSIPDAYRARVEALVVKPEPAPSGLPAPTAASPAEVLRACTAAGCLDLAEGLIAASATLEQVQTRTAAAKEIRALCATAKLPELAEGFIQASTPAAVVRAQLTIVTAKLDQVEIDGQLPPDAKSASGKRPLNVLDVYRTLNKPPVK
jgi:ATP-dependent protease ClpP protease subunit